MNRRITAALTALAAVAATVTVSVAVGLAPSPAGAADENPIIPSSPAITPSPSSCAVSVAPYVANVPAGGDDTAGFAAAMAAAVAGQARCYPSGPSGDPQAVVYVPPGTYRVLGLTFPSNLRLEVSAAATLEPAQDRAAPPTANSYPMIVWDTAGKGRPAVRNVSLVGVGQAMDTRKQNARTAGGQMIAGFDLSHDFTLNLDPAQANSSNYVIGVSAVNVQYFRIENVFSVQNGTDAPSGATVPWPTSARAVFELHARRDSPINGPFIEPMHGVITNHVDVNAPRGYGPNQINGAVDLTVTNVYSQGGTALRLETDGSTTNRGEPRLGATVDQLTATNIVGVDCNRAVSLSPHGQRNGYVTVQNVWAYSCNQAVIASRDNDVYPQYQGLFRSAVVGGVHAVAGTSAQLDSVAYLWTVGQSLKTVQIDPDLAWTPRITVVDQAGAFRRT